MTVKVIVHEVRKKKITRQVADKKPKQALPRVR